MTTNTMTPDHLSTSCPLWCEEIPCRGEHAANSDPIAVTGFATEPTTVAASPVWGEVDGLAPAVNLRAVSASIDLGVDLTVAEARNLAADLLRAVAVLDR